MLELSLTFLVPLIISSISLEKTVFISSKSNVTNCVLEFLVFGFLLFDTYVCIILIMVSSKPESKATPLCLF